MAQLHPPYALTMWCMFSTRLRRSRTIGTAAWTRSGATAATNQVVQPLFEAPVTVHFLIYETMPVGLVSFAM
jgi:hypothetical protein